MHAGSIFALNFLALISCGVAIAAPMSQIPDGAYRPLYLEPDKSKLDLPAAKKLKWGKKIPVKAFFIDPYPVTRKEFKEFLIRNPEWRRSQIKQIFADSSYLNDWVSDLDIGNEQDLESPVRYVSWFSARAYCHDQHKRLPSLAEWEYVAASYKKVPHLTRTILDWYSRPTNKKMPKVGTTFPNDFGVYDLHGLVWEWIEDFNSSLVTGESRGDSSLDRGQFCGSGGLGASNFKDYAAFMRFAFRSSLNGSFALANLGFRCAKDLSTKKRSPR